MKKQEETDKEIEILKPINCYNCGLPKLKLVGVLLERELLLVCDECGTPNSLSLTEPMLQPRQPQPTGEKKKNLMVQ